MKTLIRLMIKFYRKVINPVLHAVGGPMVGCRFRPTCSQYFEQAVEVHGVCKGVCLGIWRILRCNPWGGTGYDPVPPRKNEAGERENREESKSSHSCPCCSSSYKNEDNQKKEEE